MIVRQVTVKVYQLKLKVGSDTVEVAAEIEEGEDWIEGVREQRTKVFHYTLGELHEKAEAMPTVCAMHAKLDEYKRAKAERERKVVKQTI